MEIKKLGTICKLKQGFQVPLPEQETEYKEGLVRFIRIVDYTQNTEDVRYVKDNEKYYYVEPDDVVMVRYGAAGEVGHGISGIIANNMFLIEPITDINKNYLFYYLSQKKIKNKLLSTSTSTTMPALNFKIVNDLDIPIWDKDKQTELVDLFDKLSKIIADRKQELQLLDDLIKARFVELFGDPVHNPKDWTVKSLGELSIQINSGNTPKGGEQVYVEKGITFFRSQNVWKDRLEMDDIAYIDEETHASMSRSSLKHGDILMTKTGRINTENSSLGRAALYMGEDDAANVNGHVYFIRLKPGVNNKFILRILVSDEYRDYIRSVCVGGIDKRQLNKNHIEDFPIICPPDDMVDEYISLVEQVDKSKVVVQKSLDETQQLFDSLMQKYFG